MTHDPFPERSPIGPGNGMLVPTLSDTVDEDVIGLAILFDAAGTVKITWKNGSTTTHTVVAGQTISCRPRRVWSSVTDITAANIKIYMP